MDGLVELDVESFFRSGNKEVGVEFLAQFLDEFDTFFQTFGGAAHTHVLPHDVAQLLVDGVDTALALDVHQTVDLGLNGLLGSLKLRQVGGDAWPNLLVGQIVLDGVRQHEIAVGQTLHKGGGTQAVGTMVREVALANGEESLDGGLQLIVYPDTTHGVVDGGIDHHGVIVGHAIDLAGFLSGEHVGDLLVHLEEVAVALHDDINAQTVDRLGEVEEHGQTGVVHAKAFVAALFGGT